MNILYLITGLGMGGAERVVTDLADNMISLGHKVTLVYLVGEAIVKPESPNVDIIFLDLKKNPLFAFLKFIKILKLKKPDVVHSHMYHANIFSRISRLFHGFPKLICTSHSDFEGGKFRMFLYVLTSPLMTIATNVSAEAKNKLVESGAVKSTKMLVVNNSIDTNKFQVDNIARKVYRGNFGLKNSETCLLAVGRFHPAKDYFTLIKVFNKLVQTHQNLKLFIVGDGEQKYLIQSEIKKYGLESKITLLGIREDVPALMNMSDIFISTSAWEGFGLVLAEAMSCGKIVVASKNSGFVEILGADSPYLVEIGNVNSFCNILDNILSKSDFELRHIRESNRKIILDNYSNDMIIKKWIEIYTH
jgi:glycosyltransferase involved in cell wall biosynthesis